MCVRRAQKSNFTFQLRSGLFGPVGRLFVAIAFLAVIVSATGGSFIGQSKSTLKGCLATPTLIAKLDSRLSTLDLTRAGVVQWKQDSRGRLDWSLVGSTFAVTAQAGTTTTDRSSPLPS